MVDFKLEKGEWPSGKRYREICWLMASIGAQDSANLYGHPSFKNMRLVAPPFGFHKVHYFWLAIHSFLSLYPFIFSVLNCTAKSKHLEFYSGMQK